MNLFQKYKIKKIENNNNNNNMVDSGVTPYASYNEKFSNFKTHKVSRK